MRFFLPLLILATPGCRPAGHQDLQPASLDLPRGEEGKLMIYLDPEDEYPPEEQPGRPQDTRLPRVRVYGEAGNLVGTYYTLSVNLPPGRYRVKVDRGDREPFIQWVVVEPQRIAAADFRGGDSRPRSTLEAR